MDADRIKAIELVNLSETTTAMFPSRGTGSGLSGLPDIFHPVSENIQYSEENKYTSLMLLDAIQSALKKAELMISSAFSI